MFIFEIQKLYSDVQNDRYQVQWIKPSISCCVKPRQLLLDVMISTIPQETQSYFNAAPELGRRACLRSRAQLQGNGADYSHCFVRLCEEVRL